ncbi:MAG TPA: ester cyclase [Puia sp.]
MKNLLLIGVTTLILSCNNNGGTATNPASDSVAAGAASKDSVLEKNKATALASEEAFNSGKLDDAFKDAVPDAVDYGDGSMAPMKGLDSIKAGVKIFLNAFPDYKGENFLAIGEGNHVAVFGDWSGTFKNPLMGMKPTGKSFKIKDVDLFTFNDQGKITEHRSVQSSKTVLDMVQAKMMKK